MTATSTSGTKARAAGGFTGMAALARHRAIYAALGDMMIDDIHALSIQASTPDERMRNDRTGQS